jgi:magnesium-transporting ATPase (P-type)
MTFAVSAVPGTLTASDDVWAMFSPLTKMIAIAAVNNAARFDERDAPQPPSIKRTASRLANGLAAPREERRVLGTATDAGLLRFCAAVTDVDAMRDTFPAVFSIPFNSRNKWALTMTRLPGDASRCLVMLKGAPEYIVARCTHHIYRGEEVTVDDAFLEDMTDACQSFGMLAERVIGHAYQVRGLCPSTPLAVRRDCRSL